MTLDVVITPKMSRIKLRPEVRAPIKACHVCPNHISGTKVGLLQACSWKAFFIDCIDSNEALTH